ncbi:BREX-1 system adenine-specific DNA-methyltransferase PglX [Solidesulfovibrio magneticus]|uniref:site-specific DNA-methyltransferase (adenine-specific) n=1 Tax=Solidesulfovibrio magneticus (strain ATCC 700980 / DSM 13731 / RS-1) TaxID=573370 RepID=C4XLG6_SOLM1|nr:BREX-1 system adenine-specific DNA-methyltransferase PglX [Solidesulfovibrio magneticus]BAH77105.1 hypothetical protein DMR_36140 [Solidesulfovibrio magneticus RS-1]
MPINRNILKTYAPQARREFIQAVTDRASVLGLSEKKIEPAEVAGDVAIIAGRPFPKEVAASRKKLEDRITLNGFTQVMEEVAYTWFNRFTALRYMELHDYLGHGYRVLSNPSGSDIPEILEKATSVDLPGLDKDKVTELRLTGDKDAELYQMLLIKQCNALHRVMPALFEAVNDATELLLPQNLLQSNSPIRKLVNDIPEENWSEIEIVGWLYQFYISEKKDQVIGKVVKSEDIPAATQLFTPNWIVKYMVQNTLGRKWLTTYPGSSIKGKMEFYIEPAEQEPEVQAKLDAITPKELNPEELTFMDPACGSGHILAEAYDLFKDIYQERGYRTRDIPRLILEKNLYGLDIDDRAAQLARFTVLMKARADDRRILDPENPAKLNILAIQESKGLDVDTVASVLLRDRVREIGSKGAQQLTLVQPKMTQGTLSETEKPEVTKDELFSLLNLFENGKTFGSLLSVHDRLKQALPRLEKLVAKSLQAYDMESRRYAKMLLPLVQQSKVLAKQYSNVITNPPYMGSGYFNEKLKNFVNEEYNGYSQDIYGCFIFRCLSMGEEKAYAGMITTPNWMSMPTFFYLREYILKKNTLLLLTDNGRGVWGPDFGSCAFIIQNTNTPGYAARFKKLYDKQGEVNSNNVLINNFFSNAWQNTNLSSFYNIPGLILSSYKLSKKLRDNFKNFKTINDIAKAKQGIKTGHNDTFLRYWHEVSCLMTSCIGKSENRTHKWFPCTKGGDYRKWYGNHEYLLNWENDGKEIKNFYSPTGKLRSRPQNIQYFFKSGITWSKISISDISSRIFPEGFTFESNGSVIFPDDESDIISLLGILNSNVAKYILSAFAPTVDFGEGSILKLPVCLCDNLTRTSIELAITISRDDWDSRETSWDFRASPLVRENAKPTISQSYLTMTCSCQNQTNKLLEIENNIDCYFIKGYGLENELGHAKADLNKITLFANPLHRYGPGKSEIEYKELLKADTVRELISYMIGCAMGRYSLDEPGLIYAHSGNQGFDPSRYTSFPADEDGIVPIMDDDWFEDDATKRFVEFIRVAWQSETLEDNLKFVADSLDPKHGEKPIDTIRRFISQKFFREHHLKVYKKRPIYWLFSSGKHKAFECLVYLHRYNENTLARMRSMYVTPLQGKYNARIEFLDKEKDNASSASAAKKLQKELDTMRKKQQELREFDELLRYYADQRITLDLNDGVKVNYGKFGSLLAEVKAITGDSGD